jgi:DnaJ-class molecular chaperone
METKTLDYYKTLELDNSATEDQIWLSYHKLNYLFRHGKLPGGFSRFASIQQAYLVLKNPDIRTKYDEWYQTNIKDMARKKKIPLVIFLSGFFSAFIASIFFFAGQNAIAELLKTAAIMLITGFMVLAYLKKSGKLEIN